MLNHDSERIGLHRWREIVEYVALQYMPCARFEQPSAGQSIRISIFRSLNPWIRVAHHLPLLYLYLAARSPLAGVLAAGGGEQG
jgi:hypothetical protein